MSIATLSTLEQADFTTNQAKTLTRVLEEEHQNLATKDDIKSLKGEIKSIREEIKSLEAKMATKDDIRVLEAKMVTKAELNKINNNMIKWVVTGIFLNLGILYVLIKYLENLLS